MAGKLGLRLGWIRRPQDAEFLLGGRVHQSHVVDAAQARGRLLPLRLQPEVGLHGGLDVVAGGHDEHGRHHHQQQDGAPRQPHQT